MMIIYLNVCMLAQVVSRKGGWAHACHSPLPAYNKKYFASTNFSSLLLFSA
jgi:hypothetical protein